MEKGRGTLTEHIVFTLMTFIIRQSKYQNDCNATEIPDNSPIYNCVKHFSVCNLECILREQIGTEHILWGDSILSVYNYKIGGDRIIPKSVEQIWQKYCSIAFVNLETQFMKKTLKNFNLIGRMHASTTFKSF